VKKPFRILILLLAVAAGAAGYWWLSPPVVDSVRPTRGSAVEAVYATGVVEPVTWAKVTTVVRGRIVDLCKCEGEWVRRGHFLARLDDDEPRARLAEIEARSRFLERDVARYAKLFENRTISLQTYERVKSQYDELAATIAALRERVADYTVRAPMDGLVLRQDGEIGEVAEPGDILFWVGQPLPLWIVADIDEEDIPRVRVGQAVLIKADAFPGQALAGTVKEITPKGDPVTKSFRARIGLPDDTPLRIGMTTEVNVIIRKEEGALLVPADAVVDGRVFVLGEGRVHERHPVFGIFGSASVQVLSGLDEKDAVVVAPPAGLADGARVRGGTGGRIAVSAGSRAR
jgi:RND family efflux transporter MFP subunit